MHRIDAAYCYEYGRRTFRDLCVFQPFTLLFQASNLSFLQIRPTAAFLFFFRTDSTDSPDCISILLSISVFLTF